MTERSLVPISSFLTTTDSEAPPLLSAKQEGDVIAAAKMYLRKNHIGINPDVFQKTLGVMGDAARRGLVLEGRATFDPKERIRPLITKGLELREDLRSRAEGLLKLSTSGQGSYGDLIGPLALPISLIRTSMTEIDHFALVADPKASQELVYTSEQRLTTIPHLAQAGLDHLPEPLKGVTLDRFPTVEERGKLARNMIASFVFRGNLSPQISTQDLKDFVLQSESAKDMESQADAIAEIVGLTEQPDRVFLHALARQASQLFTHHRTPPNDDNPKSIDDFYRHFAKGLLLLHPSLEEQLIVTVPHRITADAPNIWNSGITIGEVKVPNVEMLAQALRQAEAKGDQVNAERVNSGIRMWKWHTDALRKHNSAIQKAEAVLQEREQLFLNLDDPNFELPKEAYFVVYREQQKAESTFRTTRANTERLTNILKDTTTEIEEIEQYEEYLREQYGDALPGLVSMPARVYAKMQERRRGELRGKTIAIQTQLNLTEDLLDLDLLRYRQSGSAVARLRRDDSRNWLEEQKEQAQKLLEQIEADPNSLAYDVNLLRQLSGHLRERTPRKRRRTNYPGALKDIYAFWRDLPETIIKILRSKEKDSLWTILIRQIVQKRLELLDLAATSIEERTRLNAKTSDTPKTEVLTEPAGTLVYKDLSWTKEEALKYIQKTKILRFPEEVKLDKDQIKEMRLFVLGLPLTALPQTIIGRNNLITWIMGRIKATQSPKSVNRYKQLQLYMQHELFPLPEGAGLSRKDFLDAWKKRMNFAYAICYHDEVAKKSQVVQLVYEQVMRKNFKQRLSRELESKRKGLDKLRTRDVNQEFVESLRRLNLILEPTMSNTEHSTEHAH